MSGNLSAHKMMNMNNNPRTNVAAVIIRDNKLLLAEYDNEDGLHYNFPGGGVDLNESLHDALKREVWEETQASITVGKLLAVWDYLPPDNNKYGNVHKIAHLFSCQLEPDSEPTKPDILDKFQIGIRWVALDKLDTIQLYPDLGDDLLRIIQGNLTDIFYGTIY